MYYDPKKVIINLRFFIFILIYLFSILSSFNSFSQSNSSGIIFQALARDVFNNPASNRSIYVLVNIIQSTKSGTIVLSEEHFTTTDETGVFTINIGLGKRIGGTRDGLQDIVWEDGPYFVNMKVAITPVIPNSDWNYNKNWVDIGTTIFGVVPYALHVLGSKSNPTSIMDSNLYKSKLNISDSSTRYVTPSQLASKTFDPSPINTSLLGKLNISDTATMLAHYRASMIANDAKVSSLLSDSTSMLANYKASMIDKDAYKISNDLAVANLSTNKLSISDTLKLSTWKLYSADTTKMLANYRISMIANDAHKISNDLAFANLSTSKLSSSDTLKLSTWKLYSADTIHLSKWKLNSADTTNLSTWKLNKADTTMMLANYKESMIDKDAYKISNDLAIANLSTHKLSISDTLKLSTWKLNKADTTSMLSHYRASMIANDAKVSSLLSDTASMLAHYRVSMIANDAKASSLLSDTASMLAHYRVSMIANDAKVSSLLSDTTTMLANYRVSMIANDAKVTSILSDTTTMLANYRVSMIDKDAYKISNDLAVANLSSNKLSISDTLKLSTWKLNKADTTSMLSHYRASMIANDAKVSSLLSDTTTMLANYRVSMIANDAKVTSLFSDTSTMLANYKASMIDKDAYKISNDLTIVNLSSNKLSISDTLKLSTWKLYSADTVNLSKWKLYASDTTNLSRWKLNSADTANLSRWKLNSADTVNLSKWKLNTADTANLSTWKLNKADTATMLANYKASMIDKDAYRISNELTIANLSSNKLSISDTLKLSTWKLYSADTVNLSRWKLNAADTANLSKWKLNSADTLNLSTWKLNKADTTMMLANYKASMIDKDAYKISNDLAVANLSSNKLSIADTLNLSTWKLNKADTTTMLANYKASMIDKDAYKISNDLTIVNLSSNKLSISDTLKLSTWKLYSADTVNLSRWKLNSADTANLSRWKLNAVDTANLSKWKLNSADTANLSTWKLNKADTTMMLANYKASMIGLASSKLDVSSSHYLGTTLISNSRSSGLIALTGISSIDGNAATATNVSGIIAGANGGTGIANTGKTITLGGNISTASTFTTDGAFATIGNFSTSLVSTASTNVTLPTTGTLATLSGTEILSNKTLVAPVLGDATATSLSVTASVSASTLSVTSISATSANVASATITGDIKAKRYLLTYNAAATSTIDLSTGNIFQILLTGAATFVLPIPSTSTVGTYLVKFKQDNTGGRVVTFSNTALSTTKLYWAGGNVPIITSGANKTDFMTIICDGTSYYATIVQNFY